MTIDDIGGAGGLWLLVALLLGIAELAVPGVFLVFLALAAAATGLIVLALPDLAAPAQLAAFAAWSVVAVLIGRRWYRDYPVDSDAADLNDRARQLVGRQVTVEVAIDAGQGRVRIADGTWPATGPDLPAGAKARIVAVKAGVVEVEAIGERALP